MKKLLVTVFALAVVLTVNVSQSFAAGCSCSSPCAGTCATPCPAVPCVTPCPTAPCVTPCPAAPCVTPCPAPCATACPTPCPQSCDCKNNCCCTRTFWDKLFHRNKCCSDPKCNCCD